MELQQPCVCQDGRGGFTLGPENSLDLATQVLCVVLPVFVSITVFLRHNFTSVFMCLLKKLNSI